jgi:hypothetical protein
MESLKRYVFALTTRAFPNDISFTVSAMRRPHYGLQVAYHRRNLLSIFYYNILFYTQHQSAIPFLELKNHLRLNSEHKLTPAKWRPVFKAAQAMSPLLKTMLAVLPIPQHGAEPLPFLPIPEGVRCRDCHCLRGTPKDDGLLKAHINKSHMEGPDQKWQDFAEEVKVQ